MEAASLTVSVSEAEDVDVAQKEHEARTGYKIIGEEGEPSIIDPIVTQKKLFCHKKSEMISLRGRKNLKKKASTQ